MNARQKAKKYKKLYESMQRQPINVHVHSFQTSTIKACVSLPYEMQKYQAESEYMELIKNQLAHELAKELREKMDITVDDYPPQCAYKVYGTVRVVTGVSY